jgi:hypothetical protein
MRKYRYSISLRESILKHFSKEFITSVVELLGLKVTDEKNFEDLLEAVQATYLRMKVLEDTVLTHSDNPMFYFKYLQEKDILGE